MGYILPIQLVQYYHYQNRIINKQRDKYHIEKPFKTILEKQYEETKDAAPNNKHQLPFDVYKRNQRRQDYDNAAYTGKGRNFSEMV
ncbi:hypothetical protein P5G51_012845 [Virgibacillus sp. 179-BFC.A HS]|uniref:Transposase n=1 Tax=Tigheibacillus jepli TaxID=3035914 RepID=A0ABU5CIK4_9BACI|nr:hypothetical protein [Virgibacillus sp. 179-BFC.A HS]MDY0406158.1 hypothetical protein [Virgibacillus sp. 179-BFC.A HS]